MESNGDHCLVSCRLCAKNDNSINHINLLNNGELIETIEKHFFVKCKKCGYQSETFSDYCAHMKAYHPKDTGRCLWYCPLCIKPNFHRNQLKIHLLHHKGLSKEINLPFICKECNEEFPSFLPYSDHMEVRHQKGQFDDKWQCSICNKIIMKRHFKRHFIRYHLPPKDAYKCPIRKITFLLETSLQYHIKKHKIEHKKVACSYCDKYFLYENLDDHLRLKHGKKKKSQNRKFICEECGECVSSKYVLNSHKERHAGIASHVCHICKKSFTNIR